MRLRVFIVEPSETIRHFIAEHVNALGHEAVLAPSSEICRFDQADTVCSCRDRVCGDAIILGQDVPLAVGLDFIERRQQVGCKGTAVNSAIIFRPLSPKTKQLADAIGCRYLEAHALLDNITAWLKEVAERIPPERLLVPLAGAERRGPFLDSSNP
jgi:hypothetical protein